MIRSISFIILLVTSLLNPAWAEQIIIRAGHIIDPGTELVKANQRIIVKDGKIVAIEDDKGASSHQGSVIDLADSWVLPGLMDAHVHITANYEHANLQIHGAYVKEDPSLRAVLGVMNAEKFLNAGFTTLKEIGNDGNYITAGIIKGIEKGWIKGPKIVYAGKIIAPYGGQMGGFNHDNMNAWQYEYIDADSPEEMIKGIRQNIYYGANTIKLAADTFNYFYTQEDIEVAVEEAHRAGITLTAHTMGGDAATNVILGGADGIEHGFFLDDDHLKLMKKKGTYLVGTDFDVSHWMAYGRFTQEQAEKNSASIVTRLKRAYEIGTPMAFGTDVIVDQPGMDRVQTSLEILGSWKKAGIPPMAILKAMTANAADLMAIDNERGSLKVGLQADIIAMKQNPLENIDNVHSVHFVMKDGEVIRQ